MATTRSLAVVYRTEGFQAAIASMQRVAKSFDEVLATSQRAATEAAQRSRQAQQALDVRAHEQAEARIVAAVRTANQAIQNSYRELRIKSTADIEQAKAQAISAYNALRNSGVASARDIANAQVALRRRLQELDGQLDQTVRKSSQLSENFTVLKGTVANLFSGAIANGIGAINNALRGLASNVISAGTTAEQQRIAIETLVGSAEKAQRLLKEVIEFTATTQFQLPEVTDATKQLLAANVQAEDVISTLKMLAEIASGTGKPLGNLLYVYAQLRVQNRAYTQDLMQLTNAGIPIYDELAKVFGVSADKVRKLVEEGRVGFKEINQILVSMTSEGGKFYGLIDKLSGTAGTKLSNLEDYLGNIYRAIYEGIEPALIASLDIILGMLKPLGENKTLWVQLNQESLAFQKYLKENPEIARLLAEQLEGGVRAAIEGITKNAKELLKYLQENPKAIANAVEQVGALLEGMGKFAQLIGTAVDGWRKIGALVNEAAAAIRGLGTWGADVETTRNLVAEQLGPEGLAEFDRRYTEAQKPRLGGNWDFLIPGKKEQIASEIAQDLIAERAAENRKMYGPPLPENWGEKTEPLPKKSPPQAPSKDKDSSGLTPQQQEAQKAEEQLKQRQEAARRAREEQRRIVEQARQRADERIRQQQQLEAQRLDEAQEQELLKFDAETSGIPLGGAKEARDVLREQLSKEQQFAKEMLEINQAIAILKEEKNRKIADQKQGLPVAGRDITSEINFLEERKQLLSENLQIEKEILQNGANQTVVEKTKDIAEQMSEVAGTIASAREQLAEDTPENREALAIAEIDSQYDDYKQTITEAVEALTNLIEFKKALGLATNSEARALEELKNKYKELELVRALAIEKTKIKFDWEGRALTLENNLAISELENQAREAQAKLLGSTYGRKTEAAQIEKQKTLTQASFQAQQQKFALDRDIALNPSKYTKEQIQRLQAALEQWFKATLETIDRQFQVRVNFDQREFNLQRRADINNFQGQLLGSQSQFYQNRGDEFTANELSQRQAEIQESDRASQQLFDLEKDAALNPAKYSIQELDYLKAKLLEINQINLQNIDKQFKDLGETIASVAEGALEEFFSSIFTNTKSIGEAFRDMALTILRSIAQIAAKQVVLSILGRGGGAFAQLFGLIKSGTPAYATGGAVEGPGSGTSDSILARLSNGEFVMRASAVRHWGEDFLSDLNNMRSPRLAFTANSIGNSGNPKSVSSPTIVMHVSTPDANSFRRSESQIGRDAGEMYRRNLLRNG